MLTLGRFSHMDNLSKKFLHTQTVKLASTILTVNQSLLVRDKVSATSTRAKHRLFRYAYGECDNRYGAFQQLRCSNPPLYRLAHYPFQVL